MQFLRIAADVFWADILRHGYPFHAEVPFCFRGLLRVPICAVWVCDSIAHDVWLLAFDNLPVVGFAFAAYEDTMLFAFFVAFGRLQLQPGFALPSHPLPSLALAIILRWGGLTSFLMFLSIDFIALLFELRDTRLRLRLGAAILDVGARCFIRIDTASLVRRLRRPGRS